MATAAPAPVFAPIPVAPAFAPTFFRAGLHAPLSAALAAFLTEARADASQFPTDAEVAKMTPQQYGDFMADDLLNRMGLPPT